MEFDQKFKKMAVSSMAGRWNFYNHDDGQFSFLFSTRGLPFISHLDSLPNFTRSSDGPVRLPIVDKYKVSSWKPLILFPKRKTEIYGSLSS